MAAAISRISTPQNSKWAVNPHISTLGLRVSNTTISTGTLQVGSGGTSGTLGSGAITNNGTLSLNRSSRQVLQKEREKPYFMAALERLADGPLFLEGGGQLIRDASGEIVGAIGVTGDVNEVDDLCAIDGIHTGGFRADADFDAKAAKRLNIKLDPPLRDPRKG